MNDGKAWIVTLDARGQTPRPAFGMFLWSVEHKRYVWRGELATSMGQLAELFTQASAFLRTQRNYYLELSAVVVPLPSETDIPSCSNPLDGEMSATQQEMVALAAEVQDLRSVNVSLRQANEELLTTVRLMSETSGRGPKKKKLADLTPA